MPDEPTTDQVSTDSGQEPRTFDEGYVKELRQSEAARRVENRELKEQLAGFSTMKTELDALRGEKQTGTEKLQAQVAELSKSLEASQAQAERRQQRLAFQAMASKAA